MTNPAVKAGRWRYRCASRGRTTRAGSFPRPLFVTRHSSLVTRSVPMTPSIVPYDPAQAPELVALWNRALGGRLPLSERLWRQNVEGDPNWQPGDGLVARNPDGT